MCFKEIFWACKCGTSGIRNDLRMRLQNPWKRSSQQLVFRSLPTLFNTPMTHNFFINCLINCLKWIGKKDLTNYHRRKEILSYWKTETEYCIFIGNRQNISKISLDKIIEFEACCSKALGNVKKFDHIIPHINTKMIESSIKM